jgi:hypothetical protein
VEAGDEGGVEAVTAFCCLCGNTTTEDLGQVTGICIDAEACHRRQALASLENETFTVPFDPAERLRQRLTSPTFAITGKTCEEVLATGGTLTPGIIGAALNALWPPTRPGGRPGAMPFAADSTEISGTIALEFFPGAAEALMEMLRPRCGALLFPLPSPVQVVTETGSATFLADFSGGAPVQGPQPAVCARDEGHRIGWHWYNGTWWKA